MEFGATGSCDPLGGALVRDELTESRLGWLMFGRLLVSVLGFGIAIGLDGFGPELSQAARNGLYWSVALAFLATVVSGASISRIRNPQRFGLFQIAIDVAIVTSLVHFSGGRDSLFAFLYALVTVYGALLFQRRGAYLGTGLSAVAYALALEAANEGWLLDLAEGAEPVPGVVLLGVWSVHVAGLVLVGGLASVLSGELLRTGEALDRSTIDLARLRNLHQHTVESLTSGLLTTDPAGVITSFNPEAERILGKSAKNAVGQPLDAVIPDARELVFDRGAEVATNSQRARLAYRNQRGEDLFLGLAGSVLKDVDREPMGWVMIFQDVTEVVAMEDELRRSERLAAVGEMAAKIAHEIRNPLAAISGSIQILRKDLAAGASLDAEEPERLMSIAVRETDRLNALIGDFLQYARPAPMIRKAVDLSELVRDVVEGHEVSLPEGVSVGLDAPEPVMAWVDSNQLRQVVWNLCINAAQATEAGGSVTVSARSLRLGDPQGGSEARRNAAAEREPLPRGHGWVEIVVADTGTGMPPEVQERIFEPFFTTKEEGTGLGLATVHRIVQSHGGHLELSSEVGSGTRVTIRLPRSEEQE